MNRRFLPSFLLGCVLAALPAVSLHAESTPWTAVGPEGGDARAFAYDPADPQHIYLGTVNSWLYQSTDGGASWKRLARLGKVDDLVIDNLIVDSSDSKTLYAGVWQLDKLGGGIYVSHDKGVTWAPLPGMEGQSVRALSQAPSSSKTLVAGAISGVYRSDDSGEHWKEISPEGSNEIHKVESIAIDPADPKTIYAGTWHLPWKTTDGGATWHNIKEGLIDDSDVFSIIIDQTMPSVVYASACSGIYLSSNAGELFHKVQGIPSTARRTRVLMQDPMSRKTVYAGTTEGLYKTTDGGTNWTRMTGPDVIINDVYVNPKNPQHVLLATDRGGVLYSDDYGTSFKATNAGFSQRQVAALITDEKHGSSTIYAGVVNDKAYGGVFISQDAGKTWSQRSTGLDGRDVFSLAQADDATVYAGTSHGIFRWNGNAWEAASKVANTKEKTVYVVRKGKKVKTTQTENEKPYELDAQVNDLSVNGSTWFAATSEGVFRSTTQGATWTGPVIDDKGAQYHFVDAHNATVFAATGRELRVSTDSGVTWSAVSLPEKLSSVHTLTTTPNGNLWLGGREGAFYSSDQGKTWQALSALPVNNISDVDWDDALKRVIIASVDSSMVFAVDESDKSWKWWDAGWRLRSVRTLGGHLVAASLYDGIVIQPTDVAAASQQATR